MVPLIDVGQLAPPSVTPPTPMFVVPPLPPTFTVVPVPPVAPEPLLVEPWLAPWVSLLAEHARMVASTEKQPRMIFVLMGFRAPGGRPERTLLGGIEPNDARAAPIDP